jgi:cephalosporin-C deacetylase-like acetyl esterase
MSPVLTSVDPIITPDCTYEPWTDGHAVGYRVMRGERVEYIYLNPSGETDDGQPTVFVYHGTAGDSSEDRPVTHFEVLTHDITYVHESPTRQRLVQPVCSCGQLQYSGYTVQVVAERVAAQHRLAAGLAPEDDQ